jgi:hypothetical protein
MILPPKTFLKLVLLGLSLSPIFAYSQDSLRKKRLFIGVVVSPDYSYRVLSGGDATAKSIVDARNSYEVPKLSYTAGLDFMYQFNQRLAVSVGIQYSVKGERANLNGLSFGSFIDPQRGFVYSSSSGQVESVQYTYNTTYLDIPLKLSYYLNKKKWAYYLSAGISPNLFLFEQIKERAVATDGSVFYSQHTSQNGYYSVNPQVQVGYGLDWSIKRSRMRIEPIYRMSVLRVNKGSVNGYFYSFGLNFSYLFGLGKP